MLIGRNEMHIRDEIRDEMQCPQWDTDKERNLGWAACDLGIQLSQNSGKQVGIGVPASKGQLPGP